MKRFLPLTSLLVVSFFVFVWAAVGVSVLAVDAHTLPEKAQSVLALGLPFGLVLIPLLGFGAGISGLARWVANTSSAG